jgi:dihydrofolate synthase / folylpolyglutamate synthase
MNNYTRYHNAVTYLESFVNLSLKGNYVGFYLKRMKYFLDLIGNPEKNLQFIHVTGTAGKGSVTNLIHEMIRADGKKVGSFTSPYVSTSIEKIKVNHLYISPDKFADIADYLMPFIDQAYEHSPYGHPSYFEIFLAIALVYFVQEKCEWVVLEVGLGGRYDATNVIQNTKVSVVTAIDYDHMEIIGPTLKNIAYEKAGIIKRGSVFFTGEQRPALLKMFKIICRSKGAKYHQVPYGDNYADNNARMASAVCESLGISKESIQKGLQSSKLQCRFETVQTHPRVIIDGAHNSVKISSTVKNLKSAKYRKLFLILGMAESKDHLPMLKQIIPFADEIFFTRYQKKERQCAHPRMLQKKSLSHLKKGVKTHVHLNSGYTLKKVLSLAGPKDLILITGSFFLAGELRKYWVSEKRILEKRAVV